MTCTNLATTLSCILIMWKEWTWPFILKVFERTKVSKFQILNQSRKYLVQIRTYTHNGPAAENDHDTLGCERVCLSRIKTS